MAMTMSTSTSSRSRSTAASAASAASSLEAERLARRRPSARRLQRAIRRHLFAAPDPRAAAHQRRARAPCRARPDAREDSAARAPRPARPPACRPRRGRAAHHRLHGSSARAPPSAPACRCSCTTKLDARVGRRAEHLHHPVSPSVFEPPPPMPTTLMERSYVALDGGRTRSGRRRASAAAKIASPSPAAPRRGVPERRRCRRRCASKNASEPPRRAIGEWIFRRPMSPLLDARARVLRRGASASAREDARLRGRAWGTNGFCRAHRVAPRKLNGSTSPLDHQQQT